MDAERLNPPVGLFAAPAMLPILPLADAIALAAIQFTPANGTTGVAVDADLAITFGDPVLETSRSRSINDVQESVTITIRYITTEGTIIAIEEYIFEKSKSTNLTTADSTLPEGYGLQEEWYYTAEESATLDIVLVPLDPVHVSINLDSGEFQVNDAVIVIDTEPYFYHETYVMAPLRTILVSLGVSEEDIVWNPDNKTVTLSAAIDTENRTQNKNDADVAVITVDALPEERQIASGDAYSEERQTVKTDNKNVEITPYSSYREPSISADKDAEETNRLFGIPAKVNAANRRCAQILLPDYFYTKRLYNINGLGRAYFDAV